MTDKQMVRGTNFTYFHAGPKEEWTQYRLEPPDVPVPARGKLFLKNLRGSAKVVRAGATVGYVKCDVKDDEGDLVARASSTCMKLREARRGSVPPASPMDGRGATMAIQEKWTLLACTILLSGVVLGGILMSGRIGVQRPGGNPMNNSRFTVDHVRLATDKPFEEVAQAFERQLGRFDPDVYKSLAASGDAERVRAKIEAMAGPSGFMLFATHNHGALLRLAGQMRKAVQYVVGNPLFALQMTQHDIRAGLYAPLRVLLYEDERGRTCLEYDKPSSLFGQFGNAEIAAVATMLDRKLEALVAAAFK